MFPPELVCLICSKLGYEALWDHPCLFPYLNVDIHFPQGFSLVFVHACFEGKIEFIQYFTKVLYLPDINNVIPVIFNQVAKSGYLDVLKWLKQHYTIHVCGGTLFQTVAQMGHLHVLQWMTTTYFDIQTKHRKKAFQLAANNEHLHVLDWLHSKYDVKNFFTLHKMYGVLTLNPNGCVSVLQWMKQNIGFTVEDVRFDDNFILRHATPNWLDVLKWWKESFSLNAYDFKTRDYYIFRHAVQGGHLDVLKWLTSTFPFTRDEIDGWWSIVAHAASYGHLDVLKWLTATFNLTTEDVRAQNDYAFLRATKNGHLDVLKWMAETFDFDVKDIESLGSWRCHRFVRTWIASKLNEAK